MRTLLAGLLAGSLLLQGCAVDRATATVTPGAEVRDLQTFYVVKSPTDGRGIENLIQSYLAVRGYRATAGDPPVNPPPVDVLVTYVDRWMWDITMYMLELTITFRNPASGFPMAVGNSFHTSLSRLPPEQMVEEVLGNIFSKIKESK